MTETGTTDDTLLEVKDLILGLEPSRPPIVDGVSFRVGTGQVVGVVGESGSGKTLTGLSLLDLLPPPIQRLGGTIRFDGEIFSQSSDWRGRGISMVFQEPMSALNPVLSLGFQLGEALGGLQRRMSRGERRAKGISLLRQVAMPDPESRWDAFPHQLSGGQKQRALLAMALASEPRLLVADEPTTALDVTVQVQVLRLLMDLNRRLGLSILLITHDLGVVAQTCEHILVMDQGTLVEEGSVDQIFERPAHAKTRELVAALGPGRKPVLRAEPTAEAPGR